MSVNIIANVTTTGNLTASNVLASNVFQFAGPEVLTSSGAMNPYRLTVLSPSSPETYNMTLTNPPQGTIIIEKEIIPTSNFSMTVAADNSTWTIPASNTVVMYWVLNKWLLATIPSTITLPTPGQYTFTTATFNTGGATGQYGPTISQARTGLTGTPAPSTWSGTYLNMTTQGIMQWTVPATASYTFTLVGGGGGDMNGPSTFAGRGVIITGTYTLTGGSVINIVVGQLPDYAISTNGAAAAGGGGSFVFTNSALLFSAGGGGGGGSATSGQGAWAAADGTTSTTGNNAQTSAAGNFGMGGGGPSGGLSGGGSYRGTAGSNGVGGAGGTRGPYPYGASGGGGGGFSLTSSFLGGNPGTDGSPWGPCASGGFGGGGGSGGGTNGAGGAGGGGGYGGGGGGYDAQFTGAGGGGSYGIVSISSPGYNSRNVSGYVTITKN